MNYLTLPFFKALLKKKESKIALAFSFFPMLLIVVGLFNTNFMQLSAPVGSLSFFEFFSAVLFTQYQMTLPLVVFIYIVSTIFRDEITSGIMYLYKDISRKVILNAKLGAILLFQILYIVITFFSSLFTYYVYLVHQPYTSGKLWPSQIDDVQYTVISILGTILVFLLCLLVASLASIILTNGFTMLVGIILGTILVFLVCFLVAILASIILTNGFTMLVGIIFASFSFIAPHLASLKYVFPNGYVNVLGHMSFNSSILLIMLLFVVYYAILYIASLYFYSRLEY